ncbi:MAG: acetyl-CoA carboxylase biotin carboxyl carrier protein [Armatimonadetes bacterium]|nr:acetyl-CoA carboxylase biotin carboxyl carrier protein [Armatimonadota bacterium]
MDLLRAKIDDLASLMEEFKLGEAEWCGPGWRIAFQRKAPTPPAVHTAPVAGEAAYALTDAAGGAIEAEVNEAAPEMVGSPLNSPMNGIFFTAASPTAPPFIKEGDEVTVGQVVGLIEAMKFFNEITAHTSGRVLKMTAENGDLVQLGQTLMIIG